MEMTILFEHNVNWNCVVYEPTLKHWAQTKMTKKKIIQIKQTHTHSLTHKSDSTQFSSQLIPINCASVYLFEISFIVLNSSFEGQYTRIAMYNVLMYVWMCAVKSKINIIIVYTLQYMYSVITGNGQTEVSNSLTIFTYIYIEYTFIHYVTTFSCIFCTGWVTFFHRMF